MIDYYVCTHSLDLIKDWNKNVNLRSKYLLVGHTKKDLNNDQIIVCNNLPDNIELFPCLCSYTGWYAVAKNKLYKHNTVCLLEYDTVLLSNFHTTNTEIIRQQYNTQYMISYSNTITDHYVFYKSTPWLEISLKKIHNIDLYNFVLQYKDQFPLWPTTTNTTLPVQVLEAFIEWFHPMTNLFKHDPLGAYVHERAFFIFCVLHKIAIIYNDKTHVIHQQSQSHKIQDIYGQILEKYNTSRLDSHMISEYDKTYNNSLNKRLMLHHQIQN